MKKKPEDKTKKAKSLNLTTKKITKADLAKLTGGGQQRVTDP